MSRGKSGEQYQYFMPCSCRKQKKAGGVLRGSGQNTDGTESDSAKWLYSGIKTGLHYTY
jgi:hypothetical protein